MTPRGPPPPSPVRPPVDAPLDSAPTEPAAPARLAGVQHLRTLLLEFGFQQLEDEQLEAMIREYDMDGAGQLNYVEFVQMMMDRERRARLEYLCASQQRRGRSWFTN